MAAQWAVGYLGEHYIPQVHASAAHRNWHQQWQEHIASQTAHPSTPPALSAPESVVPICALSVTPESIEQEWKQVILDPTQLSVKKEKMEKTKI